MLKKKYKVIHNLGINARFSTALVNTCMDYECDITISLNKKNADFKSIMGVMGLSVSYGNIIEISFSGSDEEEALQAIGTKLYELNLVKEV